MTDSTTLPFAAEDRRVRRILRAALYEFGRHGFAAAREGVIARHAGVSLATLRLFFPTKEELFRDLIRSTIISAIDAMEPASGGEVDGDSAVASLRDFARWFWQRMEEPGQAALLRLTVGELSRFPELAVFHSIEVMGRAAQRLERTLADGVERGEFQVHDLRATARVILSALITYAHWFSHPEVYGGLTGKDRAAAEESVLRVLVDALRVRAA